MDTSKRITAGLSEDHFVLTKDGWSPIKDITEDSVIAECDRDGLVSWTKPGKCSSQDFSGVLYQAEGRSFSFVGVRDNPLSLHLFGTRDGRPDGMYRVRRRLSDALDSGSNMVGKIPICGRTASSLFPEYTDSELSFLGWMLSDGCLSGGVTLIQSKVENLPKIRDMLEACSLQYKETTRRRPPPTILGVVCKTAMTEHTFYITGDSRSRVTSLLRVGDKYDYKQRYSRHAGNWMHGLSDEQFGVFMEAMKDGNGSNATKAKRTTNNKTKRTAWAAYGTKPALSALQAVCVTHGYNASLRLRTRKSGDNHWVLNINKRVIQDIRMQNVKAIPYTGKIYKIVTQSGNFIVRHDGKVCAVGGARMKRRSTGA